MSNPRPDLAPDGQDPARAGDERPYAEPANPKGLVDPSLEAYSAADVAVRVREEDAMQCEYEAPANRKLGVVMLIPGLYLLYYAVIAMAAVGRVFAPLVVLPVLAYFFVALRTLLNRRTLRLGAEGLVVRSGPLPSVGGSLKVPVERVQEFRASSRRRAIDNAELWSLYAVLTNGQTKAVVKDLGTRAEVEAITANFNATLGRLHGAVSGYR